MMGYAFKKKTLLLPVFLSLTVSTFGETFIDRTLFEEALGLVTVIDFEGIASGGGQANAVSLAGDEFFGITLKPGAGTDGLFVGIPDPTIPGDNYSTFFAIGGFVPTSGDAVFSPDLEHDLGDPFAPTGVLVVNFDAPTTGVGAFFLDVETAVSSIEAFDGLNGTGSSLGQVLLQNKGEETQSFAGIAADGIQSAVLTLGGGEDGVGLDDLCFGSIDDDGDADGDGIPDDDDDCPESDLRETVWILDCDSGVVNSWDADGCTLADLMQEIVDGCSDGARNYGRFVRCVVHTLNDLKKSEIITEKERAFLLRCITDRGDDDSEDDSEEDDSSSDDVRSYHVR